MIEIDWDKIRENTLKLVCGYRDTYAGKEWKCRELQEKNGQIRTEIERIFKYIQSSNSELSWFQGKVSDDILSNYIADWITKKFTHRNLLSQQNFEGMHYDFTSLIAEHESAEDYCKDSNESFRLAITGIFKFVILELVLSVILTATTGLPIEIANRISSIDIP